MPSADEVFTIAEMPGAGVPLTFIVIEPFVEFASIDPARGDRSGGRYRASVSQYRDRNLDLYSFRQWEVDLRQYLTFANELRTIALRAWTSSTFPDDGQQVPFYVQPTIGGGHSLRAYRSFRFRDRSALLLQAEYRWRLNEFMHSALFYDTGTVGPSLDDLGRLERSYGFGLRAGGRESSVFRVDVAFGGHGGHEGTRLLLRFDDVF
jgi:hemolysin activation/secretion protein